MSLVVPDWDKHPDLSWKDKIAYLTFKFRQMDQVDCPVEHIFEGDTYIREMRIPAGTLFLGREHRHGHLVRLISGTGILITPAGKVYKEPPWEFTSSPGAHVVAYILTDVVARTYHPNPSGSRDAKALEDEAFESVASLVKLGRAVEERILYKSMLEFLDVDEESLRPLFEDESDMVPFPIPCPVNVLPSLIHGKGVVAGKGINPGEVFAIARVGMHRTPAGRYTNHSSKPNAEFLNIGGDLVMIALSPISENEEITVDYRHAIRAGAGT